MFIDQYVGFPWEGYNIGFISDEFHIVRSAPNFYGIYVRL
jgi:hypothetical protein